MSQTFSTAKISMCLEDHLIPRFFQLLQKGFMLKAQLGCSIKSLLCEQLGLSPEYLDKRIQTIFLDGKPVDDVNSAIIRQGSTIALSAAMPGLVGATLRRGGYYVPMRSQISHRERATPEPLQEGMICLKLFNLLLQELGPTFLRQGFWIYGKYLEDLLKRQRDDFWEGCKSVEVDGERFDFDRLLEVKWVDIDVFLKLKTG